MIKSKAKFGGTMLLAGLTAFSLFLLIGGVDKFLIGTNIERNGILFVVTMFLLFCILFYGLLKDTRKIHLEKDKIHYINWLTGHTITYKFDDLDGYVEQLQPSSYDTYLTIYLVKEGCFTGKISTFYYGNYGKMKSALERSSLKHLGMQPFGLLSYCKTVFGLKVMK